MAKKNSHNQEVGSKIERSDERIDITAEVFTSPKLCMEMVNEIPESILKNPESKFLDNSAGCGNFLIALQSKLKQYHSLSHINNHMLYAVELMEDNHKEMCENLGVPLNHPHFVCANALEYDYSFGEKVGLENFFI